MWLQQTHEEAALAEWQIAFSWAKPPPPFVDLTGDDDCKDDGKGKG